MKADYERVRIRKEMIVDQRASWRRMVSYLIGLRLQVSVSGLYGARRRAGPTTER